MEDYSFFIGLIQFISAIVLFLVVNWIGSKSISVGYVQLSTSISEESAPAFNFLFKVISPAVFLVIYAIICQSLKGNCLISRCYFIVIFYWLFRALFVIVTEKGRLLNWMTFCLYATCSIGISLYIYSIISEVDSVLPDPKDLLNQLWLLIIVFIYDVINKLQIGRSNTIQRKERYISLQYERLQKKYYGIVHEKCNNEFMEAVIFAIMIYENFNRPKIVRMTENISFCLTRKAHTLGIMQIKTDKYINDIESIELAIKYVFDSIRDISTDGFYLEDKPYCMVEAIAERYNKYSPNYKDEVGDIFELLRKNYFKRTDEDYLKMNIK